MATKRPEVLKHTDVLFGFFLRELAPHCKHFYCTFHDLQYTVIISTNHIRPNVTNPRPMIGVVLTLNLFDLKLPGWTDIRSMLREREKK